MEAQADPQSPPVPGGKTRVEERGAPWRHLPLAGTLAIGWGLLLFLADRTLQVDMYGWMSTAHKIYATGGPDAQHRNILFSYILSVPFYLQWDPVVFGLAVCGTALTAATVFLYALTLRCTGRRVAAYGSLVFILSYPLLRYSSQVFTDIVALACLMAAFLCQLKFLENRKPAALLAGYFLISLAVSLRYANAFFLPAFIYFLWLSRKQIAWHLAGAAIAVLPYWPQLLFNLDTYGSVFTLSYSSSAAFPVMSWKYFLQELNKGYHLQFFHYLRYLFLDFRGLFFLLSPLCLLGFFYAGEYMGKTAARYLALLFFSYLLVLSFYWFFSIRYAIPALIPCFVWLAIGIARLTSAVRSRGGFLKAALVLFLAVNAYLMLELSFQVIQSSRANHEIREALFRHLGGLMREGDIVLTNEEYLASRFLPAGAQIMDRKGQEPIGRDGWRGFAGRTLYLVAPQKRFVSEGATGKWDLAVESLPPWMERIAHREAGPVRELALFPVLRRLGLDGHIPLEKWDLYRGKAPQHGTGPAG